jgi:hypothetical protein
MDISFLTQFLEGNSWFNVFTAVVALASAIAAATKTPKSGTLAAKVFELIDFLALNFGKAKDKGEPVVEAPKEIAK